MAGDSVIIYGQPLHWSTKKILMRLMMVLAFQGNDVCTGN